MHIGGYATSLMRRMVIPSDGSAGDFIILGEGSLSSVTLTEAKSTLGVTNLEDKYVKCLWFEVVNSGTSGTLTPPTNSTLLMDQWAAGVDALASTLNSGIPTLIAPETSGGIDITATLDVSGNWTLSGTPAAYPVAIIYCYKVKLKDLDDTKVIGGIEVVIEGEGGGSSAVTSVNGLTGDVVITIPVTTVNGLTGDVVIDIPVTSVNGLTGDVSLTIPQAGTDYLTPETLALTYEPILPVTPESPDTMYLNGNRTWAAIVIGSGGYAANVYPKAATSTIYSEYKQASYTNDASESVETITCSVAGEVVGESFLYESPLGITNVDAGTWNFSLYCKISTKAGTAQVKFEIFVRESGGTESILFSKYSNDLNNTDYQVIKADYTGPIYPVNTTDRMGVRFYFKSTAAAPVTLSYVYGGVNTSYLNTPLNIRHSQLRGLNDDTNYQHITSTQVSNIHAPGSDNQDLSGLMVKSSNLSDLTDATTARQNLGVEIGADVQAYDPNIAFRTDKLSAFAITTSAEFAGIISDPTGTGYVVLSDSPTFTTKITTPAVWASGVNGLLLADDGGNGIFIEDGGYVGIGTSNPSVPFEINSTITAMAKLVHTTTSGLGGGSGIYLTVNDGAAVASGDRLGYLFGGGTYDASNNFAYSAGFSFYTTENWEATKRGTKIVIEGTNTGATGRGTWMTILDGKLGIGIADPAQGIDVSGSVQATTSIITPEITAYGEGTLTLSDNSNEVVLSDLKTAVDNTHASGSDNQDLSGLMVKSNNLSDLTDTITARQNLGVEIGVDVQEYNEDIALNADLYPAILSRNIGQRIIHGRNTTLPAFQTTDFSELALGTTFDFSVIWEGTQDSWVSATTRYFIYKHDGSTGIIFGVYSDNKLFVTVNGTTYYSTIAITFGDEESHALGVTVERESTTSDGSIVFYVDGSILGDTVTITAGSPLSITTTSNLYVSSGPSDRYNGSSKSCYIYNVALTENEMRSALFNGVGSWHIWGSCVYRYFSDFSSVTDGWNATRATRTANIDGIAGQDDCLRVYASSDANSTHYIGRSGTLVPNRWYRVSLDYYIPSGNTNVNGIRLATGATSEVWDTIGSWTTASLILYYTNPSLVIYQLKNGSINFTGAGVVTDDLIYIKNIKVEQLGAICGYDTGGMQPGASQWIDSSTNNCHLVQPVGNGYGILQQMKGTFEIRWTCTWNGTHEAQYIGGFNQAIVPENGYIQSCMVYIEGTIIEDIIVGDGSDTEYWVASTTGLAAGKRTLPIAHRYPDGTNFKMIVDPDANFTGSIHFLFRGDIMEV
jgi:hypothetical protein